MAADQKKREKETEEKAGKEIKAMNAGAGAVIGAVLGHPVSGLISGMLTGNLMTLPSKKHS